MTNNSIQFIFSYLLSIAVYFLLSFAYVSDEKFDREDNENSVEESAEGNFDLSTLL